MRVHNGKLQWASTMGTTDFGFGSALIGRLQWESTMECFNASLLWESAMGVYNGTLQWESAMGIYIGVCMGSRERILDLDEHPLDLQELWGSKRCPGNYRGPLKASVV